MYFHYFREGTTDEEVQKLVNELYTFYQQKSTELENSGSPNLKDLSEGTDGKSEAADMDVPKISVNIKIISKISPL